MSARCCMSEVASAVRMGSAQKTAMSTRSAPQNALRKKTCPAVWLVASTLFSPKRRETSALMPAPVPTPRATASIW